MLRRSNSLRILGPLMLLCLAACGQFPEQPNSNAPWGPPSAPTGDHGPAQPVDVSQVSDAVPGDETPSRYGNASSYTVLGKTYTLVPQCKGYHDRGIASWYGTQFHGSRTSDGETYDMYAMTAANKVVPIPCYARVTNLKNGKSVIVKINDRGPFVENRLIDLSYAAASKLGMLGTGTALVDVVAVGPGDLGPPPATIAAAPAVDVTALPPAAGTATGPQALVTAGAPPLIYLQVGAYAERGNAEAVTQKLTAAGVEHAFVLPVADGQRTLYKVRIGPVPDVDAVDSLSGKLANLGFPDTQIVIP